MSEGSSLYEDFLNSFLSAVYDNSACTESSVANDRKVDDSDSGGEDRIALASKKDILAVTKEIGDPMFRESLLSSSVVALPSKTSERFD